MERDNYDDLMAADDLGDYDDFYDDYDDFEDDNEDGLDDLYEALMDAEDSETFDEADESYDERKPKRRRVRTMLPRKLRLIPRPALKKQTACCINPKVSQALVALKRKDIVHDRKLRDVDGRSRKNLRVNQVQTKSLGKLNKQMSLDGALEFADSITVTQSGMEINLATVLKGLIKTGVLGESKGVLGNPAVIGGLGLLLKNPNILGGLFTPKP